MYSNRPQPFGIQTQTLLQSLRSGDVQGVKRFLPAHTAKTYQISEQQLEMVIREYLCKRYATGKVITPPGSSTAEHTHKGNAWVRLMMPNGREHICAIQVVENDYGFVIGLETLIYIGYGIRCAELNLLPKGDETNMLIVGLQDQATLETMGIKGLAKSLENGDLVPWDTIFKRKRERIEQERQARANGG